MATSLALQIVLRRRRGLDAITEIGGIVAIIRKYHSCYRKFWWLVNMALSITSLNDET